MDIERRIVCAAMRDMTGQIICSPRHFDSIAHATVRGLMSFSIPWEQGFVDQYGTFLNRFEARIVAVNANQIVRRCGGDDQELYSENLY